MESPSLLAELATAWPPHEWREVTVLVAVSGGADSVALARALHELRGGGAGRLILAHYNHQMRGAASDADQAFVEELGRALGVQVIVGKRREGERKGVEESESRSGEEGEPESSEESLRALRYEFLTQAASSCGARYVAIAHTADDQVETVLHHALRGTGLAGLAGIPRVRRLSQAATLLRPLLSVTRAAVVAYLHSLGQSWREDATNDSRDYTRNRLRHELLPLLERDYNPQVRAALWRLSRIAGETVALLDQQAQALLQLVAQPAAGGVELDVNTLQGTHAALIRQLLLVVWQSQNWPLQDMSHAKWEELLALVSAAAATAEDCLPPRTFPGGIRVQCRPGILKFSRP